MRLPTFIIAGGRRCGTTSLYHWLKAHPEIWVHPETDTAYFIDDILVGRTQWLDGKIDFTQWEQNHSLEDYVQLFSGGTNHKAIGEKSADLLFWKEAHPRLANILQDVKIVIQLRNPIDRAWSHYWNEVGKNRENLPFEKAIEAEAQRSLKSDYARHHLSYVERGMYAPGLKSLLNHFDKDQLQVLILEEIVQDPILSLQEVCAFIGVDPQKVPDIPNQKHNSNWTMVKRSWAMNEPFSTMEGLYSRGIRRLIRNRWKDDPERREKRRAFLKNAEALFKKPAQGLEIKDRTRKKLTDLYAESIAELESILNRNLNIWK